MNTLPLVSIVVPVYNGERYLESCLNSVVKQKYSNLEILIINDGSIDASRIIAEEFAKKDSRVRVYHGKNRGVSSARNKGIEKASGEFIAFIDADDLVHETYILNLTNALCDTGADIASNGVTLSKLTDKEFLNSLVPAGIEYRIYDRKSAILALYSGTLEKGNNGQQVIRQSILKTNNIRFDTSMSIGEDFDFLARLILSSSKIIVDDRQMYFYRVNENSAVHQEFDTRHYAAIYNVQKAGRLALNDIPELKKTLDSNLAINSISYGALMYSKRRIYPEEFRIVKQNIRKYTYTALFNKKIKINGRIKAFVISVFGINLGLMIVRKLIKI
jgi:glycosyltransferase involved in cell wall biosynthesis